MNPLSGRYANYYRHIDTGKCIRGYDFTDRSTCDKYRDTRGKYKFLGIIRFK